MHIPLPDQIRAARERAGQTQAEAALAAGYAHQQRWGEIEAGVKRMDPVRWQWYLLVTGQHAVWRMVRR